MYTENSGNVLLNISYPWISIYQNSQQNYGKHKVYTNQTIGVECMFILWPGYSIEQKTLYHSHIKAAKYDGYSSVPMYMSRMYTCRQNSKVIRVIGLIFSSRVLLNGFTDLWCSQRGFCYFSLNILQPPRVCVRCYIL